MIPLSNRSCRCRSIPQYRRVIAPVPAIGILAYHELKVFQAKDLKERYDYVTTHEIRFFWYSVVALIISASFLSPHHYWLDASR